MKLNLPAIALLAATTALVGTNPLLAQTKSPKRGIAYNLPNAQDIAALSPGVSWWYNWATTPNSGVPANYFTTYNMTYYPMLWNDSFNKAAVESFIQAHPEIKYLLVLNEPNVSGQATCGGASTYCQPAAAAALWPQYEQIAIDTGTLIVGPQITFGTDPNYGNPETWMDAFYSAYEANNNGRRPRIDYLGFHWYDYGLDTQLTNLAKYNKPFWVTEFANWHSQNDGAQIDTLAKQEAQMTSMVSTLETRGDVFRYSWFTGRVSPDPHFDSLLAGTGVLTALGQEYLTLPITPAPTPVLIDSGSTIAQGSYAADKDVSGGSTSTNTHTYIVDSSIDTATQAVYQSNRHGDSTYTIPGFTTGSLHNVKLHFAENSFNSAGQRTFNVFINGAEVLSNYDIFLAAGAEYKARVETFSAVANSSGDIVIQFTTVKNNAMVNGIEIN